MKSSEEWACRGKDGHRRLCALTTLVVLVVRTILSLALTCLAVSLICWSSAVAFYKSFKKTGKNSSALLCHSHLIFWSKMLLAAEEETTTMLQDVTFAAFS